MAAGLDAKALESALQLDRHEGGVVGGGGPT